MRLPLLGTMLVALVLSVQAAAAADLTGAWKLEFKPDFSGNPATRDCTFTQDGQKLAIDCEGQKVSGAVKGRTVTFQFKTGQQNESTADFSGTLDQKGTTIRGAWQLTPDNRKGNFELRKQD